MVGTVIRQNATNGAFFTVLFEVQNNEFDGVSSPRALSFQVDISHDEMQVLKARSYERRLKRVNRILKKLPLYDGITDEEIKLAAAFSNYNLANAIVEDELNKPLANKGQ
jgi:hypothetical protein